MTQIDFLNDLTTIKKQTKYQEFKCELGIDHVTVLIPLKEAKQFEQEALKIKPQSRAELKTLVLAFAGLIEEVK